METIISHSEAETKLLAAKIGKNFKKHKIICLKGDLGCGKTIFTKGLAESIGINEREIKSPTYTFVREYSIKGLSFYHFDFYRIEKVDDLMAQDLQEIFQQKKSLIVIEWPERLGEILPKKHLEITFKYVSETSREITINKYY